MPSKSYTIRSVSAYNGTEEAIEELARAQETIINLEEQLENAGTSVEDVINGTVSSLTNIDDGSVIRAGLFDGCENLVSYSNKSGYITSVGENAFRNCTSLTTLPQLSNSAVLGARAFQNCSNLRLITGFSTLENVPEYCFEGCSSINLWANTNGNVGSYAFRNSGIPGVSCRAIIGYNPSVRHSITINPYAFEGCLSLSTLNLYLFDGDYATISEGAFKDCIHLSTINNSNTIFYIGSDAFRNCTSLTIFEFGADVSVNRYAFSGCTNLRTLRFEGTVSQARSIFLNGIGVNVPATTIRCSDGDYTIGS